MPRIFIAAPLAEAVRSNLARVGTAADARGVRWVDEGSLHLTLAFLGEVEERSLPLIEDAVYAATEGETAPLRLAAQGLGGFPNEQAARVMWAGVDGEVPRLIAMRKRLVGELRSAGFEVDKRRYCPHITVARFRSPQPLPSRINKLQEFGEWEVDELQVVESHLRPSGPRYVVRADVPLVDD